MKKFFAVFAASVLAASLFAACGGKIDADATVDVYMPDGATALSMAQLMSEDKEDDNVEYHVVNASTIQTYVTGKAPAAELCILPVNLASKLLGDGRVYRLLGAVTHGNLYMLSTDASTQYTEENLSSLVGKTVGVVQLKNVPGLTFKIILDKNGVSWQELTNDAAPATDKVNLKAITPEEASPATKLDCYVVPEPAASVKADKTPLEFVGDLQTLYGGENGYPQAVLVAKKSFVSANPSWVSDFLVRVSAGADWLKTASPKTIAEAVSRRLTEGLAPAFNENNLSPTAVAHSGIRFEYARDCKNEIDAFLDRLIAVDASAASVVADAFYYDA